MTYTETASRFTNRQTRNMLTRWEHGETYASLGRKYGVPAWRMKQLVVRAIRVRELFAALERKRLTA